jgi:hypothetical protein
MSTQNSNDSSSEAVSVVLIQSQRLNRLQSVFAGEAGSQLQNDAKHPSEECQACKFSPAQHRAIVDFLTVVISARDVRLKEFESEVEVLSDTRVQLEARVRELENELKVMTSAGHNALRLAVARLEMSQNLLRRPLGHSSRLSQ